MKSPKILLKKSSSRIWVILLLLILAVSIWYANWQMIKIINASNPQGDMSASVRSSVPLFDSLPKCSFRWQDLKRDPFNVLLDTVPKPPPMPDFFLKGVVMSKGQASALMQLGNGAVYVLKQGETYMGVKIDHITPRSVIIQFRGKKHVLPIIQ